MVVLAIGIQVLPSLEYSRRTVLSLLPVSVNEPLPLLHTDILVNVPTLAAAAAVMVPLAVTCLQVPDLLIKMRNMGCCIIIRIVGNIPITGSISAVWRTVKSS